MGIIGRGIQFFILLMVGLVLGEPTANAMGAKKPPVPPPDSLEPGEPAYCALNQFVSQEVKVTQKGLTRAHLYRLGHMDFLGVAVGDSQASALQLVATDHGVSKSDKSCTWYFNEGNTEAEKAFEHQYLTNPKNLNVNSGPEEYHQKLGRYFSGSGVDFIACAADKGYLAMGCNGMKHRGPSVFAMVLAFSGCNPKRAAAIANYVWGLNGVQEPVRLAIAEEGARMGRAQPSLQKRLRGAFEKP